MFNQSKRTTNAAKSSFAGTICNVANIVLGFAYRTIFIYILGVAYLGLNGLFTSVLTALSLAELGFTTVVIYRFYKPISLKDVNKVGQLMNFLRVIYLVIASVILLIGLALIPFLHMFIKNASEIPSDINLVVIYLLFLLQSVATYLWSYRLTILEADQRGYTLSLVQFGISFAKYVLQTAALVLTGDFTVVLGFGVASTLLLNFVFSYWTTLQYREVFAVKEMLPKEERRQIYSDTFAASCHKLGSVVLTATDNIVLSSFVGVIATGLYSNYSLIITSLSGIMSKLLGGFTGSLGNAHEELDEESNYNVYKRLSFADLMLSGLSTACLYLLIDDFILVWLGADYLMDDATVIALCVYYFLSMSRLVNLSYTAGVGLFVKDRARPFIEAAINIAASIALVLNIGIAGVFIGTSVSFLATVFWREPWILHKFEFHQPIRHYFETYAIVAMFTVAFCIVAASIKCMVAFQLSWFTWIAEAIVFAIVFTVLFLLAFGWTEQGRFFAGLIKRALPGR